MTSTNTHTNETTQPRDFVAFLLEQSQGKTNSELSAGLRDLGRRRPVSQGCHLRQGACRGADRRRD